jgi:hypothetical protein
MPTIAPEHEILICDADRSVTVSKSGVFHWKVSALWQNCDRKMQEQTQQQTSASPSISTD